MKSTKIASKSSDAQEWFVEQFHLSSPLEEFEEHARLNLERCREEDPQFDSAVHQRAIEMVMTKLQPASGEDDQ